MKANNSKGFYIFASILILLLYSNANGYQRLDENAENTLPIRKFDNLHRVDG